MSVPDPTKTVPAWKDRAAIPRFDNKHGANRLPHQIYIHIDPGTRELLYIGISCENTRPVDFKARLPRHRERLEGLLAWGWRRDQIARIAGVGLRQHAAQRLEAELIGHLRPPFNLARNPDASRGKGVAV